MNDVPRWIFSLYRTSNAGHALTTSFLLDLTRSQITEMAEAQLDGRQHLRQFALDEISSNDPEVVALSLIFLSVVGDAEDLAAVEGAMTHDSDLVRRAARVCQYELQRLHK